MKPYKMLLNLLKKGSLSKNNKEKNREYSQMASFYGLSRMTALFPLSYISQITKLSEVLNLISGKKYF